MPLHKYTIEDLKRKAENLAVEVVPPVSILLHGEVGAGKTTFSQFFIKNLIIDDSQNITSPTFNIVQIYETTKGSVWHVDLYRLKKEEEVLELGLLEAMNECVCLIEWPEMLKKYISQYKTLDVFL